MSVDKNDLIDFEEIAEKTDDAIADNIDDNGNISADTAVENAAGETPEEMAKRLRREEDEKRYKALNDYIDKMKDVNDYSDSYSIKIEMFEGPIDLLLHLVKSAKIKIQDIAVSKITDQYLSYMNQLESVDLEKASGFIEIAAILIEIKSKALLPRAEEEDDPHSAQRELIQKIDEYRLIKEVAEKMKQQETIGQFFKAPDESVGDVHVVLKDMNMDGLMKALQKLFLKMEKRALTPAPRKVTLDRFTVSEKMSHIKDAFFDKDEMKFSDLFEADYSKSEIITTFQAMLELLKLQFLTAKQEDVFDEITIRKREAA